MLECCFTMSVITALLFGFISGIIVKKFNDNRINHKFPSAPTLASAV